LSGLVPVIRVARSSRNLICCSAEQRAAAVAEKIASCVEAGPGRRL
jgi:hypothetical protein